MKLKKKKVVVLVSLIIGVLMVRNVAALLVPVDTTLAVFNTGSGLAKVNCKVFQDNVSFDYIYTYKIINDSTIGLSFFSVAIYDDAVAQSPGHNGTNVAPSASTLAGNPAQSVDYLFGNPVYTGENSSVLRFVSDSAPVEGFGTLFGTKSSGIPVSVSAAILTPMPVPEPATILLLGTASLFALRKKRYLR